MPDLYIYKASAGSGKTNTLVRKYLDLLFRNPHAYRWILAVTFTNKAAGEMKTRIISSLSSLAGNMDKSMGTAELGNEICRNLTITPEELKKSASVILDHILNDYSRFSVGTIDKFFQIVIRSFARETGLQASYNLELDNLSILNEAADNLLYEMDVNETLKKWLVQYAEYLMISGKSLNLRRELVSLGEELFRESYRNLYRQYPENLLNDEKIKDYLKVLNRIIFSFKNEMKDIGQKFLETVSAYHLELNDFRFQSTGFAHYFRKIIDPVKPDEYEPRTRAREAIDNPSNWYTGSSTKKDLILAAFEGGLNDLLKKALQNYSDHYKEFRTALTLSKFIYAFAILNDLSKNIRLLTTERNLFLLSDSSRFLNEIIGDNDAPFIYEKAGTYFKNFMIDEFQDTSVFQWKNFRPLVANSLAEGYDNLIVGDVKQSIYRWRNSDWDILETQIENEFPGYIKPVPLVKNWRSRENIIAFNNYVFSNAPVILRDSYLTGIEESPESRLLAGRITSAYKDSVQLIPEEKKGSGGFARLTFLKPGLDNKDYDSEIRQKLPLLIRELQDRGYRAGEIAILVRSGKTGRKIASLLLGYKMQLPEENKYNFNLVSNDSLYLSVNPAVRLLVSILRLTRNRADRLNEVYIRHEYLRYILDDSEIPDDYHAVFSCPDEELPITFSDLYRDFLDRYDDLVHLSLFELTEELILIFRLNANPRDLPYIQAFQDIVLSYMAENTSDIASFLGFWDERGSKKTLAISEQLDAIRIITIHKAKGLEFRVVIIPYCNWDLDHQTGMNILWLRNQVEPFDQLPFAPVNYSSALLKTWFSLQYQDEKLHAYVDNLNLLYVAMTRAEDELYIFTSPGKNPEGDSPLKDVGDLLFRLFIRAELLSGLSNRCDYIIRDDADQTCCESGIQVTFEKKQKKEAVADRFDAYPVNTFPENLRIRYRSEDLFSPESKPGFIEYGTIMHEILSRVNSRDDLERSIDTSYREGKFDESVRKDIIRAFSEAFNLNVPEYMFREGWKAYNERPILSGSGEYRPDRIMIKDRKAVIIDYKFGSEVRSAYRNQMKQYLNFMKEAGYEVTAGYIWYVLTGNTEEIRV